jgi:hypothetical protein
VSVTTTRKKNKRTTVTLAQPPSNHSRKSICSVLDALHLWQFVVITVDLHFFLSTYQSVCLAPHQDQPFLLDGTGGAIPHSKLYLFSSSRFGSARLVFSIFALDILRRVDWQGSTQIPSFLSFYGSTRRGIRLAVGWNCFSFGIPRVPKPELQAWDFVGIKRR